MSVLSPQATAFYLEIGGVDRTAYLRRGSVSVNMRLNMRWDASFDLYDPEGSLAAQEGKNVLLKEMPLAGGEERTFYGKLDDVEQVRAVDNALGTQLFYRCKCVDLMARLDQRVCSEWSVHKSVTAGYIVNWALSLFAYAEGIAFSPAASPGGFIEAGADVEKFVFNKQTVLEVIEQMCQLSDFVAWVDVSGDFHFEVGGSSYAAPFSISATSANFTRIAKRRSKTEGGGGAGSGYFNQSWTRTSWAAWEQRLNTFTGDGSGSPVSGTTEWTLYDPDAPSNPMAAAVVVEIKVNGERVDFGGEEEGRSYTWKYGETTITQALGEAVLGPDDTLEVWFHDMAQGFIFVQDLTEITARGVIEGNTGQCARIFDDSQETNFQAATDKAQAKLDIAKSIPDIVTLEANGFGSSPIYPRPGMLFAATLSYPSISGSFIILEVSAREVAGAGLAYTCKCVKQGSSRRLANGIDYFRELARKRPGSTITGGGAGDGGPKSGPIPYRCLLKNTAVGDNITDVISVYGAVVQQASKIRRIVAVLKETITEDLVVRFRNIERATLTEHVIGEFTLPAASAHNASVVFDEFDYPVLGDLSTLAVDIVSSDGAAAENGVASWVIETVGRGSGLVTAAGMANLATYNPLTEYATGDIVASEGKIYISLVDGNLGNTPASSPGSWEVLIEGIAGPGVATGGTTGQQLVKASGTDYDTAWVDRVSSVAGRTGAVTLAESDITGLVSDLAAKLDDSQLDTDGTLAANSDTRIASQKAVKTYVDARAPESVQLEGSLVGTRKILNFIAGLNVTLSVVDDSGSGRVNITINATGGGGGGAGVSGESWVAASTGGGVLAW